MLKPTTIPRGIANLFALGDSVYTVLSQDLEHRTDKVLSSISQTSFKDEILNNYLSNISPISAKKQTTYILADALFRSYFANGR